MKNTIKMFEILVSCARTPIQYRRLKQQEIINDYKHCLNEFTMKVLHELIEYKKHDDPTVTNCVRKINKMAIRDLSPE